MPLPFANPYEARMRRIVKSIKSGKDIKPPEWMHKDVFEDLRAALDYSSKIREKMGDNLSFVLLFGGIMRAPFESHKKSDIDIIVVLRSYCRFLQPEERRISPLFYPEGFVYEIIKDQKPESSFVRNVFLQSQATLEGKVGKTRFLRSIAQKNFVPTDLAPLILHRIKKYGLDVSEKNIGLVIKTLGVLPWVFEQPSAYEEILDAVFGLRANVV
jgi:predicted nucleotidyltransferase